MADLIQTPASVIQGSPFQSFTGVSGAAITAGQSVYRKNADQKFYPAQANGSQEQAGQYGGGIALDSAPGAGQYVTILQAGQINLGATLTVGQTYVTSPSGTLGAIAPISDLGTGNYVTILGVAISASILVVPWSGPFASNSQHS